MNSKLANGVPKEPENAKIWLKQRLQEKSKLSEFLEQFKAKFSEYSESKQTIDLCESTLKKFHETVDR